MNVCGNSVLFRAVKTFDLKKNPPSWWCSRKSQRVTKVVTINHLKTMNVCTALHNSPFNSWTFLFVSISAVDYLIHI